ncbi:MAG: pilus assembly protein PilM [Actinomycetota bacterium]|nr:pilus assembly protein PilM [Actinomycetota bacterium]
MLIVAVLVVRGVPHAPHRRLRERRSLKLDGAVPEHTDRVRIRSNPGKRVVGLDIQPGYVAAVEGHPGQAAVHRAATAVLAPEVVRDGEVIDADTLAVVLREMFAQHKLGPRVRLGVANHRIVMRTLDLPPLSGAKEIASAVRFQAQDQIPMPLDEAVIEHHTLGTVETSEGRRTRVVLVAARRDMVDKLVGAIRKAGLRPQGIDLSAFAMIRALYTPGNEVPTLYVSVGGVTNLAVAVGRTCVFTRVAAHGTEGIAGELGDRRGLTLEHARAWLKHVGLTAPTEETEGDSNIVEAARDVLEVGIARIADELRTSLDFHATQDAGAKVEKAILTGPAIEIPGFCEQLAAQAGIPLEAGVLREGHPGALGDLQRGLLAVATGLSVEEVAA